MDIQSIIPSADPIPLPAPFLLLKILLIVTFILHIIAMNIMFGGGIIALIAKLKAKSDDFYHRLFVDMAKKIPAFLAATITLGIAPLLFLQVLYGQYFYTSSVIMAWAWFFVIILLLFAYYGFYVVAFKSGNKRSFVTGVLASALFLIFLIGFFYTNNITLMSTPAIWKAKYLGDPGGLNLNWSDATLVPRYLHFLFAAFAVGGLFVALFGALKFNTDRDYSLFLMKTGGKTFNYVTMLQILIGLLFWMLLPRPQMLLFMGKNLSGTILLMMGIILSITVIILMSKSLNKDDPRKGIYTVAGIVAAIIIVMSIIRDILRDSFLDKYFHYEKFQVVPQWDVLIIFLILFITGVVLWFVMMKKYFAKT